ncbi:MAG: aminopeptidase P N-terminal domain-containing protein [Candidatus Aminicenantes bacterium]|nr:MAG: aminopeptidase P N-terminal domain-containing protein [Candidatus Aminicenantes bacterium]
MMNRERILGRCLIGLSAFLFISVAFIGAFSSDEIKVKSPVYAQRRTKLMDKMQEGIAIFKNTARDKDFYYLTGCEEQDAAFLLVPDAQEKFILFIRPYSAVREIWSGKQFTLEETKSIYGADKVYPMDQFERILFENLRGKSKIYYSLNDEELNQRILSVFKRSGRNFPGNIVNPLSYVHEMRLIKGPEEISLLRKAVDITCDALNEVYKAVQPGMFEYEIQAIIEYFYRKNGATVGFSSIVGSGPNATMLHYNKNDRQIREGDLLLMDVGAAYAKYTADITRTIPVGGTFSQRQKEVYEIVLDAQKQAISVAKPGVGIHKINQKGVEVINEGLFRLGLITDKKSDWQHRVSLMYYISHWIGLAVHDVGGRGPDDGVGRKLEPGMVLTVEPGIYIRRESFDNLEEMLGRNAPEKNELEDFLEAVNPAVEKYAGIGIRIEDDILITKSGHEILSKSVPKEIDEIRKLMKKDSYLNKK